MQYVFPQCSVLVDEAARYVETRFPDGSRVGSTPNSDPHSLRTARRLGYGEDTWRMSRDHEIAHTWLAHRAGLPWSPTMWRLAHPSAADLSDDAQVAEEESLVLEFQRLFDKESPPPWVSAPVPAKRPLPW